MLSCVASRVAPWVSFDETTASLHDDAHVCTSGMLKAE